MSSKFYMNIKFTKSTIVHPILFAMFPILLITSSNLNEVIFLDAGFSLLIVVAITIVSWIFLNLFLKNRLKSGLLISLGLILFFSYGYFTRIISQIGIDASALPFSYTTIAIPFYGMLLIVGLFGIIKIKKYLKDINIFANIVGVVIILMLLSNVVSYSLENNSLDAVNNEIDYRILHEPKLNEKPNIYYIILDEYTSDEILLDIYNYDNLEFLTKLAQRGFHIPTNSYTNYATSPLAISANLDMSYFNDGKINPTLDDRNEFYNNNQLMQILKSLDYTIINMSLDYGYPEIADHHLCPPSMFVNQFHNTLIDGSLWNPFSKYFVTAGDPQRDRVNCKFSELSNLENSFDTPFFVFAHIMSPHPPYLFGPNGESLNSEFLSLGADSWNNKSGYVHQVQYINKKIIETVDKILQESDSAPVIIIQGDHGTPTQLGGGGLRWNNINDDSIRERMSIFSAIYLPNTDSAVIYDGITPVNYFRLILNTQLNGNYELLEDRMYFSSYQDMLNFTDVTSSLQK
jgi:hypothetical protein